MSSRLFWRCQLCIACLVLIIGDGVMAQAGRSQSWRIEIERTDRFIRSREYRLGSPRSLSWVEQPYQRNLEDPWGLELAPAFPVEPWPALQWEIETEVPDLDQGDPSDYLRLLREPFLGKQASEIPGNYLLTHYVFGLVDRGRLPKKLRIEYEQTAYRGVCTLTVLSWGEARDGLEDYVPKVSSRGVLLGLTLSVDVEEEPIPPLSPTDRSVSMDGVHLGMDSKDVLELWGNKASKTQVQYRHDRGTVILLGGPSLQVEGKTYEVGGAAEPLTEHLRRLGFEDFSFPLPDNQDEAAQQQMKLMRENHKMLRAAAATVTLVLADGQIKTIYVTGGYDGYELEDRGLDWMGPRPTVHGLSLPLKEEQVMEMLGPPLRTHQAGKRRTLCYHSGTCHDGLESPVKLHITFEGDRCRAIRGTRLEQAGELRLGSRFRMPPQHSLEDASQVLSSITSSLKSRITGRADGPVAVAYSTDLGLEVWIYPDGSRQFILRDVDLPKTVVNLEFP